MSEIYVGKIKNLGKLGEDVMQRNCAWLSKELMQAISISQTVLKKDHLAYQMFSVLALSAKETSRGTTSTLLRILDEQQEQYEKLKKQREYLGFQY